MTLSSLFIVCSHGRRSAHGPIANGIEVWQAGEWCPGGRPATLEDLGGEKVWWCLDHNSSMATMSFCYATFAFRSGKLPKACERVERILIPLPQMVAGESL